MKFEKLSERRKKSLTEFFGRYDVAIITGASSGIGYAMLELLRYLNSAIKIINISRTPPQFSDANFTHISCDLGNADSLNATADEILHTYLNQDTKKILLINNSGFGGYGFFPEPSLEHNCKMIDLNCRALTALCGKFLEKIKLGKGSIINVCSTAAWQACPHLSVYAATKSYVMSFTLALDFELRKYGSNALCLCPGPTSTNFFKAAGFTERPLPSNFGHDSLDVAIDTFVALSKNKSLRVVGVLNSVQAMMTYLIPKVWLTKISGSILSKIRSK